MDFETFRGSLPDEAPPPALGLASQALWWDAKGDWQRAHDCAQRDGGPSGSIVHAYLHRKEGDQSNAGYWYRRAGRPPAEGSLKAEWEALARELADNDAHE
jgi:hypothetical protein